MVRTVSPRSNRRCGVEEAVARQRAAAVMAAAVLRGEKGAVVTCACRALLHQAAYVDGGKHVRDD